MSEIMDGNRMDKPEAKPTTNKNDETALTQMYSAHIHTGEPPLQDILKQSNGSKTSFRKLIGLLNDFSQNRQGETAHVKPAPKDYQMRELQAQALLRLRLWIDYEDVFMKKYKKKFGGKGKKKKLTEQLFILRDISHLFSLAAFRLSPQEPFDEFLRCALGEIPGEYLHKQQIFDAFEVAPIRVIKEEVQSEPVLPSSRNKPAKDDSQKPKAKRKKSEVTTQADQLRSTESSKTVNKPGPISSVLSMNKRLEITAPIRRNSLIQKSRFVGSHFNAGNVDALFRHVKSSIPASRTVNIPQGTMATEPNPKCNPDIHGQVLYDAPQKRNEEANRGIFQTSDKPVRRRSSLVADALRALKRRDKK